LLLVVDKADGAVDFEPGDVDGGAVGAEFGVGFLMVKIEG